MESIKPISEQTASELADTLYSDGETMSKFAHSLREMMSLVVNTVVREAAGRFLDCMERYVCSTFITKWYWKRNLRRSVTTFHEIVKLRESIFCDNRI